MRYVLAAAFGFILQMVGLAGPEHIWPDAGNTWYTVIFRIFFVLAASIAIASLINADGSGKKHKYEA